LARRARLMGMSRIGQAKRGSRSRCSIRRRPGLAAAITAVVAVLGTSCGAGGSAGAGHGRVTPAPVPAGYGPRPVPSGGAESLNAVAAIGASDAWVVGTHWPVPKGTYPLTVHWDGKRWTAVPCPSPGGTAKPARSTLEAVAIDAPHDAWAVGHWSPIEHLAPTYLLIVHWNGVTWSIVPAPRSRGFTGLTAVAAISPTAAWAIGYGTVGGRPGTVFLGWDGTRWRYLPSPVGMLLTGLAVISARDIWVVGTKTFAKSPSKHVTLAEHWDGAKWTIVPTPNGFKDRPRNSNLNAVAGTSGSNAWASATINPARPVWTRARWRSTGTANAGS
jgi:hypothetical protein